MIFWVKKRAFANDTDARQPYQNGKAASASGVIANATYLEYISELGSGSNLFVTPRFLTCVSHNQQT